MQKLSLHIFLLASAACGLLSAQTGVSLRDQSRNVDFSTAPSTRPVKTGAVLPATCEVGQMFFLTGAIGGRNLYGCSEPNVWALQSGGGAAAGQLVYSTVFVTQTELTIPNSAHGLNTADFQVVCWDNSTPAQELPRQSTTVDPESFQVNITFAAASSGRCVLFGPARPYVAGPGLVESGAEWQVDPVLVPGFLTATADLAAWTIPAATCQSRTFPMLGAALGDAIAARWPSSLPDSLVGNMLVPAAGEVKVRLCNITGSEATAPAATFGASILRNL